MVSSIKEIYILFKFDSIAYARYFMIQTHSYIIFIASSLYQFMCINLYQNWSFLVIFVMLSNPIEFAGNYNCLNICRLKNVLVNISLS
jgi:hypothetical protein